ncbi:MAG: hypothetical protein GY758_18640 [Fuerstiella sp.]|nr:hypothetical protein [Fuerstiella sp.]MCP4511707.1 hypothetical protein [Fuerstiella sp.]
MQHKLRYLFLAGATLLSATGPAAEIQQVGGQCADNCNNRCAAEGCRQGNFCNSGQCYGDCCNQRSRHEDFCLDWCGRCGPVGRAASQGCPTAQKIVWCCKTKASGDSGWAPPARLPVNRTGGWYQAYWPGQWYGNPGGGFVGGAPVVYHPTDTTQMGYSYNRVPTWRPNPGMIPRVPRPSNFHARMCPRRGGQSCYSGCNFGPVIGTPVRKNNGGNCPTCDPGYVSTTALRAAPQLANTQLPAEELSYSTVAPAIVPAQSIRVPESYTGQVIQAVEQSADPAAEKSVRRVSTVVTKQACSSGPGRPGKRVSRPSEAVQRRTKKSSGGWFGLPSLSEIRF